MCLRYKIIINVMMLTSLLQSECDPKQYTQSNQSQYKYALEELPKLNLSGKEKVLDIGSGDGLLSAYIAKELLPYGQLVGIDNSAQMVSFSSAQNVSSNVDYQCADICEYVVPNEYDAIVSFATLHWVSNYEIALHNIAQSLKPGGAALLMHGVGTPLLRTIAVELLDTPEWQQYKKGAEFLTYPEVSASAFAVEKSGLNIEHFEVRQRGAWMPRESIVQNWISLGMFSFIPSEIREEYCNQILDKFTIYYPANDKDEIFRCTSLLVMVLKKQF
jgi:trans-aconitate methyltransferase